MYTRVLPCSHHTINTQNRFLTFQMLTRPFSQRIPVPGPAAPLRSCHLGSVCFFPGFHVNGLTQSGLFYAWVFSLSMVFLRCSHVVATSSSLFLFTLVTKVPLCCMDMEQHLFNLSPVDGHLSGWQFGAVSSRSVINIYVQFFFCGYIFSLILHKYLQVELLGS